eukprot:GHVN01020034.1.p1 GENE.GHVN01020034.1~~GHVN01020034.1.p1  ORF type:complete len:157 (+),score=8.32 GHVN01020034.1:112-582(+)
MLSSEGNQSTPLSWRTQICDFGLACHVEPGALVSDKAGSTPYMSPEIFKVRHASVLHVSTLLVQAPTPYDPRKADIWALGVLLHVVLTGTLPKYQEGKPIAVETRWPSSTRQNSQDLLATLTDPIPSKRPWLIKTSQFLQQYTVSTVDKMAQLQTF